MGLKKVDPCQLLKDEDLLHYQSHLQEEKQSIVVKKKKKRKKSINMMILTESQSNLVKD